MSSTSLTASQKEIPSVAMKPLPPNQRGMLLRGNFQAALKALTINGTRSFLTMLGVIIGVASVLVAMIQTEGTSARIEKSFADLGTNILTIMPGKAPEMSGNGMMIMKRVDSTDESSLTVADAKALADLSYVAQVSPVLQSNATVIFQNQNDDFGISGVTASYQQLHSLTMAAGSWFSPQEDEMGLPRAVLGPEVARTLFGPLKVDPIGQTIRVGTQLFKVVGVIASADLMEDATIFVPVRAAQSRLTNTSKVGQIEVLVDKADNIEIVQQSITSLLEYRHRTTGNDNDFWIQSVTRFLQSRQESADSLAALLIGIAAIALTVGGIGIMNIMLVSVTERTREIGIRMAMGARQSDVRNQFLIEALVLSLGGGLIGVLIGLFAGLIVVNNAGLPFILNPFAVLIAVSVAGLIGIFFGLYPALRAANLDPIVALRLN